MHPLNGKITDYADEVYYICSTHAPYRDVEQGRRTLLGLLISKLHPCGENVGLSPSASDLQVKPTKIHCLLLADIRVAV